MRGSWCLWVKTGAPSPGEHSRAPGFLSSRRSSLTYPSSNQQPAKPSVAALVEPLTEGLEAGSPLGERVMTACHNWVRGASGHLRDKCVH